MSNIDVAVGGVGGSGTRVVSEILTKSGYFVGNQLNPALDNLLFTILLRQPEWETQFPPEPEILYALDIFISLMRNRSLAQLSEDQLQYIKNRPRSSFYNETEQQRWQVVVNELLDDEDAVPDNVGERTGWKEPNTHIFLPQITTSMPALKYVHVIRNGFYMAFSRNQRQVGAWHKHYSMEMPASGPNPILSLEYWIRSNQRAITYGKEHLADRFYLLNYDLLCENPFTEVSKFLDFLEVRYTDADVSNLSSSIQSKPAKPLDMTQFSQDQIAQVAALGYAA